MNKNVFKMFLNEDLADKELDEALPKDLAKAYDNSSVGPDKRKYIGKNGQKIDWQNVNYEPLTVDQGKELWKTDPSKLILIIQDRSGNDRVVKFREDGKVDIDPAYGNYRFDLPVSNAYVKRDGTKVVDVFKAKINHLLSIAKKIYKGDENVYRDQASLDSRAANPESPHYAGLDKSDIISKFQAANANDLLRKLKARGGQWAENIARSVIPTSATGYDIIKWDPVNHVAIVSGSYGGAGNADYWLEKFLEYYKRWSSSDGDTWRAWCAYLLAKQDGDTTYRNPTEAEIRRWYNISTNPEKDLNARIRYLDVEKVLSEPKERVKQSIEDAKRLERNLENAQSKKSNFTSPEARQSRESDISYYINRYKDRLMTILAELEKYEGKMDELDASDARRISEYDKEISDISQKLSDAKAEYGKLMSGGAYKNSPFGKPVPESLTEEKSLDELVDQIIGHHNNQLENLNEDFDKDRVSALAEFLDINPDDISEVSENDFDTPDGEYLVLTEEEAWDRAVDEVKMLFDDMGLNAFTPEFQKRITSEFLSEDEIDNFIEGEIEYYSTEEDDQEALERLRNLSTKADKINYIKDVFGDLSDFVRDPDYIDIDAVADEAINQDGVAHFIAYYDGEENELGNGFLAYRVN